MPGHQSGHAFFLDRRNRILFTGDGLETGSSMVGYGAREGDVYGEQYANVSSMYHEFKALAERMDEIDYLFPAHGILNVESRVLPAVLKGLEHIVNDPEHPPPQGGEAQQEGQAECPLLPAGARFYRAELQSRRRLPQEISIPCFTRHLRQLRSFVFSFPDAGHGAASVSRQEAPHPTGCGASCLL